MTRRHRAEATEARARTVLVRVTGRDRPGITAGLLHILDEAGAAVEDMEQIVLHGRLNLGLEVIVPGGRDLLKELLLFGWEHEIEIGFEVAEEPVEARHTLPAALKRHEEQHASSRSSHWAPAV